jgi:hypothetical protein
MLDTQDGADEEFVERASREIVAGVGRGRDP